MTKKTPQAFIEKYKGQAIDDDGFANVQCVDGFRLFNKYLGYPVYPTYTGWADGYWYYRQSTYSKYYDFITDVRDLKFGDWCFWAIGSSCVYSHVAMFVGYANNQKTRGLFFGQNQGNFGEFRTVEIKLDILGAFRAKMFSVDETKAKQYVETLYKNILNRKADTGGLKTWTNALIQGQSPKYVVKGFFLSNEYKNKNRTNEEFVRDCYLGYLQRKGDSSGVNYWLKKLETNGREFVLNGFGNSAEYRKVISKYGF